MPVYEVQDSEGRKLQIEGDSAPTEGELETIFDQAFPRSPSQRPAITAPGEAGPKLARPPLTPVTQAFPAVAQVQADAPDVPLSAGEVVNMLQTPQVEIPNVGEEGTVLRGVSELATGLAEQTLLTPVAPLVALAAAVPATRLAAGATLTAMGAKASYDRLSEGIKTGNAQAITEGVGMGALTALGGYVVRRDAKLPKQSPEIVTQAVEGANARRAQAMGFEAAVDANVKPVAPATAEALKATATDLQPTAAAESGVLPKAAETVPEAVGTVEPAASTPLGIAPAGSGAVQKFIDAMMPRDSTTPPPISLKPNERLPSPRPFEEAKQIFAQPFGMGKLPVIGYVADANTRIRTPVQESVNTYYANRFGVGPAIASALGEEIKGTIDPYFTKDPKTGAITNITPNREGLSLYISDVFETLQRDPDAYTLTPEQQAAWQRAKSVLDEISDLQKRSDVSFLADGEGTPPEQMTFDAPEEVVAAGEAYFPRIVIERPTAQTARSGGSVGAKQFFQKSRMFDSEAEGVSLGTKYEPSIEKRLTTLAERTYKAAFDKQLANDPALGGKTRAQVRTDLEVALADKIASGEITAERINAIVDSKAAQGKVYEPGLQNIIFDPETAKILNKALPRASSDIGQLYQNANSVVRDLTLAGDISSAFIQLLPTLYANPVVWSKAIGNSFRAMAVPETFSGYVKKNADAVRELAQLGSSVGQLESLLSGGQGRSIIQKTRVGKVLAPLQRQFQTSLDVAKVELWKAWREVTPPEQRLEVARAIESQLGSSRIESAAIKHNQAFTERAFLLANSYYRGALNYVTLIGQNGIKGQIARRGLGSLLAGGVGTYIAVAKGLGMSNDEIQERLDPRNSLFLKWQVKVGDKVEETGFGAFYRSLLRLTGDVIKTSVEHPENWATLATDKNPFTKWLRGHSSLLPGMAFSQLSGSDFLGEETTIGDILPSIATPLASRAGADYVRDKMSGKPSDTTLGQVAYESLVSFIGGSAFSESKRRQTLRLLSENSKREFGKEYEQLSIAEQRRVAELVQSLPTFKERGEPTKREREMAFQADIDRVIRIRKSLPDEQVKQLDDLGVKMRGFDPALTLKGVKIPLTNNQSKRYEELIKEEYGKMIPRILPSLTRLTKAEARQKVFDDAIAKAREVARARMLTQAK